MIFIIKKNTGRIGLLISIIGVCMGSKAQNLVSPAGTSSNKDTFMCWTGHYEKGKFITGNGGAITINPKTKCPEISFPAGKDPMQQVIDENNRTEQAEKELQEEAHQIDNGIKIYPVVAEAVKLYEKLKEETNNIILQKIDWGEQDDDKGFRFTGPAGLQEYLVNKACPAMKPVYDDIMNYVEKIKNDQSPDLPVPPAADYFNCWGCDKKKRDNYDTLVKYYVKNFYKEDALRIRNVLSMERELMLVFGKTTYLGGQTTEGAQWGSSMQEAINQAMGSNKHPTSCTFLEDAPYKLNEALTAIMKYSLKKADLLARKYLNKHYELQIRPVILVCLDIARQAELLGMNGGEENLLREAASSCTNLYMDWRDKKVKEQDFSRFADIPFLLAISRQSILLGSHDESLDKQFEKLMNDDQFRLTIDVETNVGHAPVFQVMQYHSDGYVVAVWDDDSTGCLKWIPVSAKGDKNMLIYTQLREARITGPSPHLEYAGTHDFYADVMLKAHFCQNEQHDTLFIKSHLLPEPANKYIWTMAGTTVPGGVFESFSGFQLFIDPMKAGMETAREAQSGELQKNLQQNVIANGQEALQKAKQLQQMQGKMSAGEMQSMLNQAFQSANSANSGLNSLSTNTVKLPVDVSNKNTVLIDQTFDAADFNPTAAQQGLISTGKIRVRLEYKPRQ